MLKRLAFVFAFLLGSFASATLPAQAAIVENGDFVGAKDLNGDPMPAVFNFTSHTYLTNFAWGNTGCYCLDWIAPNGSAVIAHAPANPLGYAGNVYVADASPLYNTGTYLLQELTGLVANQTYVLTFLQAAGSYFTGTTDTAQWDVGFGGDANTYGPNGWELHGATHQSSALMTIDPATGTSGWTKQTLTFTATGASELLSFFATGTGAPPFALLANVSVSAVPEPATWVMMILGLGLVGVTLRRAQAKATAPLAA